MSQSGQNQKAWSTWHERLHKKLKKNPRLLPPRSNLLLSISGGQDSMALLKLIIDLKRLYEWKLEVWHGDHGWHKGSSKTAQELKAWCSHQKINCFTSQGTIQETKKEEDARNWRYKHLIQRANLLSKNHIECSFKKVLTGHTATDRAETILMNLARGADLCGLSALNEFRYLTNSIELIRPLLIFSREDTWQICKEMKLPIWLDPTNENVNLTRNQIRKEILPILNKIYTGADLRIAASGERLMHYKEDQNDLAKIALLAIKNENSLSRKVLFKISPSARRIILLNWIKENGISTLSAVQMEEITFKVSEGQPPGKLNLPQGWTIQWNKELIKLLYNN